MSPDKLIYMTNQIAKFFHSQPEAEANAGVAEHINKFWEPRMRAQLFEMTDRSTEGFGMEISHTLRSTTISSARPVELSQRKFRDMVSQQ